MIINNDLSSCLGKHVDFQSSVIAFATHRVMPRLYDMMSQEIVALGHHSDKQWMDQTGYVEQRERNDDDGARLPRLMLDSEIPQMAMSSVFYDFAFSRFRTDRAGSAGYHRTIRPIPP